MPDAFIDDILAESDRLTAERDALRAENERLRSFQDVGMFSQLQAAEAQVERLRAALDTLVMLWDSLQRTAGPVMGAEDWQHAWRDARDLLR